MAETQHPSGKKRGLGYRLMGIPTPVIFVLCAIVAVAILWWQGGISELVDVLKDAELWHLAIAAPIYVASVWLLCLRWHVLVKMAQGWSDQPKAAEAFLASVIINYAAPVGLAVPSRAALTKRALGLDASATGTIALWEIGADVIVLGLGSILWLIVADGSTSAVQSELADSTTTYALWGGIGLMLIAVAVGWYVRKPSRRAKFLRVAREIALAPKERPVEAFRALLVTLLYWIVQGVVLGILVDAMGVSTSWQFILGLTTVPMLIGMLSPIPGGAVIREALMYVVARLADVPGREVVAAAVIYRMALFIAIPILYAIARIWIARRKASVSARREPIEIT